MVEIFRIAVLALLLTLVLTYPFAVMGPGRPRHTWWAVAMGESFCLAAALIMIYHIHEPLQLTFDIPFLTGTLCGLMFVYNSFSIYRPFSARSSVD